MEIENVSVEGPVNMEGTYWNITVTVTFRAVAPSSQEAVINVMKKLEEL